VIVDSNWRTCGIAAEIAAIVVEETFNHLNAPIIRVTTPQIPEPVSPPLIELLVPNTAKIVTAAKKLF
jgi:pyruvate dehydrogenase E1 component beta subunit